MRQGINAYTRYDGLLMIREAIAKKFLMFNKARIDPEKNIIVSAGATGAFYSACLALLDPGDEVIVLEPFYQYHVSSLMAVGVVPVPVSLVPPDWPIVIEDIASKITPRTKAIVINTPGNPSGKVFTSKGIAHIADLCIDKDIFLFRTRSYEYFVYDGRKHTSAWDIEGARDRTIVISGYSKTFSITGWRIGYCVCDERWAQIIGYVNDLIYVCAPAPLQVGVAKGIMEFPPSYYENISTSYQKKRISWSMH